MAVCDWRTRRLQGVNTAQGRAIRGDVHGHCHLGIRDQHLGLAPIHFLFVRAIVVAMVSVRRRWALSSAVARRERIRGYIPLHYGDVRETGVEWLSTASDGVPCDYDGLAQTGKYRLWVLPARARTHFNGRRGCAAIRVERRQTRGCVRGNSCLDSELEEIDSC